MARMTRVLLFLVLTTAVSAERVDLVSGWKLKSSALVKDATGPCDTRDWIPVTVPSTVLNALVKAGIYPDPRVGLNAYQIPDSSDEFNQRHDLAKFSYLPDKRNPWRDPYWYRTEFALPKSVGERRVWLNFNGLNYRADIWLNGKQVADSRQVVGSFSRYRFDVTEHARMGQRNCLAVKIHPPDHVGVPDTQLEVCGKNRNFRKEIMKDVTLAMMAIGYDCAPTVPDRQTGLWQDVWLEFTGPVVIRDPFVVTRLPLPNTGCATLEVSAELVNTGASLVRGVLRGRVAGTEVSFEQPVELAPGETKLVRVEPKPVMRQPRLWWPKHYGEQHLYELKLEFAGTECTATFGVRQITKELHKLDNAHGLRVLVNGQKIFCRGGYIQPEVMFDWDAKRIEAEIRYLTEANINIVYFEDIPNPPDVFLELCDRYGLMFGNCFYGCYWMQPNSGYPTDLDLLARGTVDIIKRYRNHPSLVLYMAQNEGEVREDVYTRWRKDIIEHDGTRLFIPSGSFPDYRTNYPSWFKPDLPTGINDYNPKSYSWVEPAQFFRWVRESRNWMFILESGAPSVPPISSLRKFIPDFDSAPAESERFPLTPVWAHHDACHYFKPFDDALRRIFGRPKNVVDYCQKAAVLSADQHRAMYEAANHRMWEITSGVSEWKLNACWPSVEWQIYDWYLKPMPSFYYIRKACEPLHVQLTPLDSMVSVINHRLEAQRGLEVVAQLYEMNGKLRWEKRLKTDVPANSYKEVFDVPPIIQSSGQPVVHFVKLQLKDRRGQVVSDNFYWLPSRYRITQLSQQEDLIALEELPPATVRASMTTQTVGAETVARVRLENPGKHLAFFVQATITRGAGGGEIVPVLWNDNYISLVPGEVRELTARFATADAGGSQPVLEVGGWNVETDFDCTDLKIEPGMVTATIANTFLDGSRVTLYVDGKPAASQWAWARGNKKDTVTLPIQVGQHQIKVGRKP